MDNSSGKSKKGPAMIRITEDRPTGVFAVRGDLDGDEETDFSEKVQFIGLQVGREEFLLPISSVSEIVMLRPITYVPNAPKMIDGVFNLRGKIMPAINLRRMMGFPMGNGGLSSRIVIARCLASSNANDEASEPIEEMVGLLVDGITFVASLLPSQIESQSIMTKAAGADLIVSISKLDNRVMGIIDVQKIVHVAAGREIFADPQQLRGNKEQDAS